MYIDDIKLFAKNEKELEKCCEDIQRRYRDEIWLRKNVPC